MLGRPGLRHHVNLVVGDPAELPLVPGQQVGRGSRDEAHQVPPAHEEMRVVEPPRPRPHPLAVERVEVRQAEHVVGFVIEDLRAPPVPGVLAGGHTVTDVHAVEDHPCRVAPGGGVVDVGGGERDGRRAPDGDDVEDVELREVHVLVRQGERFAHVLDVGLPREPAREPVGVVGAAHVVPLVNRRDLQRDGVVGAVLVPLHRARDQEVVVRLRFAEALPGVRGQAIGEVHEDHHRADLSGGPEEDVEAGVHALVGPAGGAGQLSGGGRFAGLRGDGCGGDEQREQGRQDDASLGHDVSPRWCGIRRQAQQRDEEVYTVEARSICSRAVLVNSGVPRGSRCQPSLETSPRPGVGNVAPRDPAWPDPRDVPFRDVVHLEEKRLASGRCQRARQP